MGKNTPKNNIMQQKRHSLSNLLLLFDRGIVTVSWLHQKIFYRMCNTFLKKMFFLYLFLHSYTCMYTTTPSLFFIYIIKGVVRVVIEKNTALLKDFFATTPPCNTCVKVMMV